MLRATRFLARFCALSLQVSKRKRTVFLHFRERGNLQSLKILRQVLLKILGQVPWRGGTILRQLLSVMATNISGKDGRRQVLSVVATNISGKENER